MKVTITEKMKLQLDILSLALLLMVSVPLNGNNQNQLVVSQQEMAKAEAGGSVNISCSSNTPDPVYSVTWTLGCNHTPLLQDLPCYHRRIDLLVPDPVQLTHSPQVPTYESKATLTIINLTENDSGTFCCHIMSTGGKRGTGNGTRLEVAPRSSPEVQTDQGISLDILYVVVGAEACVIVILIAVVMRYRPQGFWRSEEQTLPTDPSELQYAEISKKNLPSRPRINVDAVTYSAVKVKKEEHLTNQGYESY